jgi:hypothetical protein
MYRVRLAILALYAAQSVRQSNILAATSSLLRGALLLTWSEAWRAGLLVLIVVLRPLGVLLSERLGLSVRDIESLLCEVKAAHPT